MRNSICGIFALLGVLGLAAPSQATVITFESLAHNDADAIDIGPTYAEGGYLFTNTATVDSSGFDPSFATMGTQADAYTGSTALLNDNYEGPTVLTRVGGGAFNLNSITLAPLYPTGDPISVSFTGTLAGGGTTSQTLTLDGVSVTQDFTFGTAFSNLVSVSWAQTDLPHQFDNVGVNAVPEPGAIMLLGSSLLGLAGLRLGRRLHKRTR